MQQRNVELRNIRQIVRRKGKSYCVWFISKAGCQHVAILHLSILSGRSLPVLRRSCDAGDNGDRSSPRAGSNGNKRGVLSKYYRTIGPDYFECVYPW
jgi:hypothetical protein